MNIDNFVTNIESLYNKALLNISWLIRTNEEPRRLLVFAQIELYPKEIVEVNTLSEK